MEKEKAIISMEEYQRLKTNDEILTQRFESELETKKRLLDLERENYHKTTRELEEGGKVLYKGRRGMIMTLNEALEIVRTDEVVVEENNELKKEKEKLKKDNEKLRS